MIAFNEISMAYCKANKFSMLSYLENHNDIFVNYQNVIKRPGQISIMLVNYPSLKELLKLPYANQSKRALRPNSTATASALKEDSAPSNHHPGRASV